MNRFGKWNEGGKAVKIRFIFFVALLSGILWGISFWQGERLKPYAGDIQVRYQGQGVSSRALEEIREEGLKTEEADFPETAAWNVEYDVEARNPELNFKQSVTCIMVRGQMDQVVKDRLAAGTYGFADDGEGCVVSSKTAWELFGSIDVVGEWILVKGKRFVIRAVTAGNYPMVIVAEKRLKAEYFSNISFSLPGYEGMESLTDNMIMRFGLPENGTKISGNFYYAAARLGYTLPGWALFVCMCLLMRRFGGLNGKKPDNRLTERLQCKKTLRHVLAALMIAGTAVGLIRYGFRFSEDFIPTRWSDFSFYTEKFRQIKENLVAIAMLPKTRWDVEMIRAFELSLFCAVQAAILLFITGNLLYSLTGKSQEREDSDGRLNESIDI